MQLKFKKITSWLNFESVGKDKGIYWLSFGGKSGYIGLSQATTIFIRWNGDHDAKGKKWVSRTVRKRYPGWSLKIDNKIRKAVIHIWTHQTPRKRGRPPISKTSATRKKILEAIETIIIFNMAITRRKKDSTMDSYKNRKVIYSSDMLLNQKKVDGVSEKGKKHLNYLKNHLGGQKLIIVNGPGDAAKISNKTISALVKEILASKPKLTPKRKAAKTRKKNTEAKKKAAAKNKKTKNVSRKSPSEPAKNFRVGTRKRGKDGNMWTVITYLRSSTEKRIKKWA